MRKSILATLIVGLVANLCGVSYAADGNLRYSITVSKFKNEAGWSGQWDVGDGFTTIMTDALHGSGSFIVLGDAEMRDQALLEQDLAASGRVAGGKKAPKMGRMTGAELLVRGSITHVQQKKAGGSGGIRFKGIKLGGKKDSAEVNITIYLVDSATGQVKASTKVIGKSGGKGLAVGYHGSGLGGLTGDMAGFKKDNVGKACENAVAQAIPFLEEQLDDIPWSGSIALVKGEKIAVNRGSREGIEKGMKFVVGTSEEIIDDDTGEVLDIDVTEVATIEITTVKEKLSYCKVLKGEGIEKGMTVSPEK